MPFETKIENWARDVVFRPRQYWEPTTIAEVGDIVRAAVSAGRHVRALGSSWSYAPVMKTDDVSISLDKLTQRPLSTKAPGFEGPLGSALRPEVRAAAGRDGFAWVHGGMKVKDVLEFLDDGSRRLALWTMGASAGQSIAGLLATGSHGADFDRPPPGDYVRALYVVGPDGQEWWIEPGAGLTTDAGLQGLLPGIDPSRVVRDDLVFRAAMVSVGSLGIIVGLVIQVRPAFSMVERIARMPLDSVLEGISSTGTYFKHPPVGQAQVDGVEGQYTHLEVFVNLYEDPLERRDALVVTRFEAPRQPDPSNWQRQNREIDIWQMLGIFIDVKERDDHEYYNLVNRLSALGRENTPGWVPSPKVTNTGSGSRLPVASIELAIPTTGDRHVTVLKELIAAFDKRHGDTGDDYAGFWSIRFTRPSVAHLAMQAPRSAADESERVMHVELFILQALDMFKPGQSEPTELEAQSEDFVRDWMEIARKNGVRLHWAQWSSRDDLPRATQYTRLEDYRRGKRRLAERATSLTTFDDDYSASVELAALHAGWTASRCIPTSPSNAPFDTRATARHPAALLVEASTPSGAQHWLAAANGDGRIGVAPVFRRNAASPFWKRFETVGKLDSARFVVGGVAGAGDSQGHAVIAAVFDDGKVRAAAGEGAHLPFGPLVLLSSPDLFTPDGVGITASPAGRFAIVGTTRTGLLRWTTRNVGASAFGGWSTLPGPSNGDRFVGVPAAAAAPDGRVRVVVRGALESYFLEEATVGGGFTLTNLGVSASADPSYLLHGGLEVIVFPGVGGLEVGVRNAGGGGFAWDAPPLGFQPRPGLPITLAAVGAEIWLGLVDHDGFVRIIARRSDGAFVPKATLRAAACSGVRLIPSGSQVLAVVRVGHDILAVNSLNV